MGDIEKLIATRIHPRVTEKTEIWKLIADSYVGGLQYIGAGHLFKYPKEGRTEYAVRAKRSVFFNHIQPICDTLAGFIFSNDIDRKFPTELNYIESKASKQKDLNSYMHSVAIQSLQYTVGTLVESPSDAADFKTMADRREAGKNPYLTLYFPWQIRDFSFDDKGELLWIILDNTFLENKDPLKKAEKKEIFGLWERDTYKEIEKKKNEKDQDEYVQTNFIEHNLGKVPFVFHNFRDMNDDIIAESPVEDMALLDRAIYNFLSCFDEMIHAGTFKMLFVPVEKKDDIPQDVIASGVQSLSIFPYNGKLPSSPKYDGVGLQDVEPFIKAVEMYLKEIFSKVGLDKDQEKAYVQSGIAKKMEFKRCESLLRLGAKQLEQSEVQIFKILSLWEDLKDPQIEIKYQTKFTEEDIESTLTRLYESMALPIKAISDKAIKEIAKKTFAYMPEAELKEFLASIEAELKAKDKASEAKGGASTDAVEQESQARLRGTVGGVDGILAIQEGVAAGTTDYEAGVSILMEIYGFDREKAVRILGTPGKKKTDGYPINNGNTPKGNQNDNQTNQN